jgi:hypothetical protein
MGELSAKQGLRKGREWASCDSVAELSATAGPLDISRCGYVHWHEP